MGSSRAQYAQAICVDEWLVSAAVILTRTGPTKPRITTKPSKIRTITRLRRTGM